MFHKSCRRVPVRQRRETNLSTVSTVGTAGAVTRTACPRCRRRDSRTASVSLESSFRHSPSQTPDAPREPQSLAQTPSQADLQTRFAHFAIDEEPSEQSDSNALETPIQGDRDAAAQGPEIEEEEPTPFDLIL